jgi:hypothetical protein
MSNIYTVRTLGRDKFRVVKFDGGLQVQAVYELENKACSCPQSRERKLPCRHSAIAQYFKASDRLNSGWFLDYDRLTWIPPIEGYE